MSHVSFFSALYVKAPPIPQQKLFENNVTTWIVNFSEYIFSVPCKYPSYVASLSLDLSEVPSSTLKKVSLIVIWSMVIISGQNFWKVGSVLACVKILNRSGFSKPPSLQEYTLPSNPLPQPTPFRPMLTQNKNAKLPRLTCSEDWEFLGDRFSHEPSKSPSEKRLDHFRPPLLTLPRQYEKQESLSSPTHSEDWAFVREHLEPNADNPPTSPSVKSSESSFFDEELNGDDSFDASAHIEELNGDDSFDASAHIWVFV